MGKLQYVCSHCDARLHECARCGLLLHPEVMSHQCRGLHNGVMQACPHELIVCDAREVQVA